MKMKKVSSPLCLTAGLFASVPGITGGSELCTANSAAAPAIPKRCATAINPTPVDQSKNAEVYPTGDGCTAFDVAGITGPVAAYMFRANIAAS